MDSKEKIIELRRLIPIPIQSAKEVLNANNGDVTKSFHQVKLKFLKDLQIETGYKIHEIEPVYLYHKYDYNLTVSHFKSIEEDKKIDYKKLEGISQGIFDLVFEFRRLENHEGLLDAILFDEFDKVHSFFKNKLELSVLADILLQTREDFLKRSETVNFKQSHLYQEAMKTWDESQIKFDKNYEILLRNYHYKNENTTKAKRH